MVQFFMTLRDAPLSTKTFTCPLVPQNYPRIEYNLPEITEILCPVFAGCKFLGSLSPFRAFRWLSVGFLPAGDLRDPGVGLLNCPFKNFLFFNNTASLSDRVFYKFCKIIVISFEEALNDLVGYLARCILQDLEQLVLIVEMIVVYKVSRRCCAEVSF